MREKERADKMLRANPLYGLHLSKTKPGEVSIFGNARMRFSGDDIARDSLPLRANDNLCVISRFNARARIRS